VIAKEFPGYTDTHILLRGEEVDIHGISTHRLPPSTSRLAFRNDQEIEYASTLANLEHNIQSGKDKRQQKAISRILNRGVNLPPDIIAPSKRGLSVETLVK